MNRRTFLKAGLTATGATALLGDAGLGAAGPQPRVVMSSLSAREELTQIFLALLNGFIANARRTDETFSVCDFRDGTILKGCSSPSGHTYVSVARMMPMIATWIQSGNSMVAGGDGKSTDLRELMHSIFTHAFDPAYVNYWGASSATKADQHQVEACLVAYAFWLMGEPFQEQVGGKARAELQNWLASCTRVPEHKHNHAWFSAINQAARLQLAEKWAEFHGDEAWMNADLAALDDMARADSDGWYNDYPGYEVYDYYNFWTYASHFLYWTEIAGDRYPQWRDKFLPRLKEFLVRTPEFFAANGSHVLFGRSLIYRWAVVLPLVLAYKHGLWPHSPGLLRRIVQRNIRFFWIAGAFDQQRGKLLESFTPNSSVGVKERYVDNGHPYWCMQAFAFLGLKKDDAFWSAPDEQLPVEKGDYQSRFPVLGMTLIGTKESGQVRWLQSRNLHRPSYRDKYIKFGYSSHFPFNVIDDPDVCPWDQALVFRNVLTGESAGRTAVRCGDLLADGSLVTEWSATLGACEFSVTTRIRTFDEFEERTHSITAADCDELQLIELLEGSYSHGLHDFAECEHTTSDNWIWSRNTKSGAGIMSVSLLGHQTVELATHFLAPGETTNVLYLHMAVNTLRTKPGICTGTFVSLHYASPVPYPLAKLKEMAGLPAA